METKQYTFHGFDAKKLAHNSCTPVRDCYVNNNIKLAQIKVTIHFVTNVSRVLISQKH